MGRAALEAWFPFRQITVNGAAHPETRQAVRAYAEQFDWAETTRCQLALFKQIMGSRRAADPNSMT